MADETGIYEGDASYEVPDPILDEKEENSLDALSERYLALTKPGPMARAAKRAGKIVPSSIKDAASDIKMNVTERNLYIQSMKVVAQGFKVVEEQAARFTISEQQILKKINSAGKGYDIKSLDEICLVRSYDIDRILAAHMRNNLGAAFAEGAATGVPGFAGLPFNIVLSTFLFFRAVQSTAMFYGYDVKNDPDELMIAEEVFMKAMSPSAADASEMGDILGKVMLVSKTEAISQAAKKGWAHMAESGGVELLLVQMRALANKAAKKALEKAGEKGLENSVFKAVFEQIGARLTQKTISRALPVVSGGICALMDTALMNRVLKFAQVFYSKRFLLEKGKRLAELTGAGAIAESGASSRSTSSDA